MLNFLTIVFLGALAALGPPTRSTPATPDGAAARPQPVPELVAAEGRDPFALVVQPDMGDATVNERNHVFCRSLERSLKGVDLYAASGDDLYRIGDDNTARLISKIRVEDALRVWFASPRSIVLTGSTGAVLAEWHFEAELGYAGTNGYFEIVSTDGVMAAVGGNTVLLERTVTFGALSVSMRASLVAGKLVVEFPQIVGAMVPFVFGKFSAILAEPDPGIAATLPIAGLTLAPDRRLLALSEGETDPYGCPGLYELTIRRGAVGAVRVATVMNESIHAIEYSDDGTLWGAGNGLYILDPDTGADTLVATTGLAPIVDLDFTFDEELLGVTYSLDTPSQLVDLTPDGRPIEFLPLEPAGPYWAIATRLHEDLTSAFDPND